MTEGKKKKNRHLYLVSSFSENASLPISGSFQSDGLIVDSLLDVFPLLRLFLPLYSFSLDLSSIFLTFHTLATLLHSVLEEGCPVKR